MTSPRDALERLLSPEEAILRLRDDPEFADLVRDAYLDWNVVEAASRFERSAEFGEVLKWLGDLASRVVVDLGAGNGVASLAFSRSGASRVLAVEPDPSDEIGRGALRRLASVSSNVEVLDGAGEAIPVETCTADIVYARQVLHHVTDLNKVLGECYRVLRPGGRLVACREHVVDDHAQLEAFLAAHPVHQLTGGEHAYSLAEYRSAIVRAGFVVDRVFGPLDSVVNAFPSVRTKQELRELPRDALIAKFGVSGHLMAAIPGVRRVVRSKLDRPTPGRLYSFVARRLA